MHQASRIRLFLSKNKIFWRDPPTLKCAAQMSTMSSSAERWSSEATSSSLELRISLSRCFSRSVRDVPVVSDNCSSPALSFYINEKETKDNFGISINQDIFPLNAQAHVRNLIWGVLGSTNSPLSVHHVAFQPLPAHIHTAGISSSWHVSLLTPP